MNIPVAIEDRISVYTADIGDEIAAEIVDLLTIKNEEKIDKEHRNIHGWWELEDEFVLADIQDAIGSEILTMPRGFMRRLGSVLRNHGHTFTVIDGRTWQRREQYYWTGPELRPHQPLAVQKSCVYHGGIYVGPTGSGKTVVEIKTMCELQPAMAMIYVNRIDLVDQWIRRLVEYTSLNKDEIGRIGDGEWSEGCVTVGTIQSVYSALKRGELDPDFFVLHDFVLLDECHHATAYTFNEIMSRHYARHRKGTSATPAMTGQFELATATLGDIYHEDDYHDLVKLGVLMEPHVEIVDTGFDATFWGDHHVEKGEACNVPGCPKSKKQNHGHRNNYSKVLGALVKDKKRNQRIAYEIVRHRGHHQIIVSNQTTQLDALEKVVREEMIVHLGDFHPPIFMLTGKVKGKKREEMIATIEAAPEAIVFTTVGKEGLDIPIVSRLHLIFPTKNVDSVQQMVGRAIRIALGKQDCIIIDYRDKPKVFRIQLRKRIQQLYVKRGLEILFDSPEELRFARHDERKGLGSGKAPA